MVMFVGTSFVLKEGRDNNHSNSVFVVCFLFQQDTPMLNLDTEKSKVMLNRQRSRRKPSLAEQKRSLSLSAEP